MGHILDTESEVVMEELTVPKLPFGTYRHYKGKSYRVIGIGLDTETEKPVVIYSPLYESEVAYWVRPFDMFVETVEVDGVMVPRFALVEESSV